MLLPDRINKNYLRYKILYVRIIVWYEKTMKNCDENKIVRTNELHLNNVHFVHFNLFYIII